MSEFHDPIALTEREKWIYNAGYVCGQRDAQKMIDGVREFLRGSTYSVDRLVGLMHASIEGSIQDKQYPDNRPLCKKGHIDENFSGIQKGSVHGEPGRGLPDDELPRSD